MTHFLFNYIRELDFWIIFKIHIQNEPYNALDMKCRRLKKKYRRKSFP